MHCVHLPTMYFALCIVRSGCLALCTVHAVTVMNLAPISLNNAHRDLQRALHTLRSAHLHSFQFSNCPTHFQY